MDRAIKVTKVATYEVHLNASDIRDAFGLPDNARVSVHVPGGGDWSNCDLCLDTDVKIEVTYKIVES